MRLTDRTSLTTAALNDLMHIVDISDKTDSDEGTSKKIRIDDMGFQLYSQRGSANGYVPLNGSVKIDANYLPSYVDDVLEFTNRAAFPATGETGKIYIAKDSNFVYRWSGSTYIQVGGGGSGDVETVFGRMGNIVASQGDYKTSLITNDSNVSGTYLDDALDWLSNYSYTKGQSDGRYVNITGDIMTGDLTLGGTASIKLASNQTNIVNNSGAIVLRNNGTATVLASQNETVYIRPQGDSVSQSGAEFRTNGDLVIFGGSVTANGFYESSDIRLKKNIESLNYGLNELEKINTYTWNWKKDGTSDMGVIAQELETILPELVNTDNEGFKSVNYPKLIPVLINAIKELSNGKK